MLARIAAPVAVDAPPVFDLANAGAATESGVTEQDVQEVMIAVAPVVGTAKVVSAGGNMMRALGFAIKVAEADLSTEPAVCWGERGPAPRPGGLAVLARLHVVGCLQPDFARHDPGE